MKLKETWRWLVKQKRLDKYDGLVKVEVRRVSIQKTDLDNVAGGFKPLGDALVKEGIIKDDSPDILVSLTAKWEKAPTRKSEGTVLIIENC